MRILESFGSFKINEGDTVLIHYWWDDMITPVKIVEKKGRKFLVSHDIEGSYIKNAPDEWVKTDEIIDIKR
ncbi:MAG: hypothetical protein SLAVMIC_00063 [uncultured marine phage]|uniref:Uncharacterized protein n=1 Tax=uncultured marine phage TaxID=707152 RepID=A0A8D9C8A1_9VIRU|nr:MAG: hypothetical protein SLAVMIC_00063 [uncultured marine phage]